MSQVTKLASAPKRAAGPSTTRPQVTVAWEFGSSVIRFTSPNLVLSEWDLDGGFQQSSGNRLDVEVMDAYLGELGTRIVMHLWMKQNYLALSHLHLMPEELAVYLTEPVTHELLDEVVKQFLRAARGTPIDLRLKLWKEPA